MNVLLIWENTPEEVKAYLIKSPSAEQLEVLTKANGTMINVDEDVTAVNQIMDAISPSEDYCDPDGDPSWRCIWKDTKVDFPINGPIDKVFICGMVF